MGTLGVSRSPLRHYVLATVGLWAAISAYYLPYFRARPLCEGEGATYYLPMRQAVAEAWRQGRLPLWTPDVYGGMPLLANPQAGAFYPPNLLYLVLPPVTAMNAILVGGYMFAGLGIILLLRAYVVRAWAALAGAV